MKPKKSLGQNFLTSVPARIEIVKAGDIKITDTILEIGPGTGFLTEELLKTGAKIICIETDRELIPHLKEKFKECKNFTLVEGDALDFDPTPYTLHPNIYKLIANIPYYITGAILRYYLTNKNPPTQMVVLVQKEVAERIVARDEKESILSLSVKAYGNPSIPYRVKRGSFNPIPNVDSAVLSIGNISHSNFVNENHENTFFELVKSGFSHKRKLLLSNIKPTFPQIDLMSIFGRLNIPEKSRAEDIPLNKWIELSKEVANLCK